MKLGIPTEEEVRAHVRIDPVSGCWIWTRHLSGGGYAYVRRYGGNHRVARIALEWSGKIPPGKIACHRCNVRACVNPAHLYVGTYKDNMRDRMVAEGRPISSPVNALARAEIARGMEAIQRTICKRRCNNV